MWPARSIGSVPMRQISRKDRPPSSSVLRIDQLRLAWSPPEWVVATSCCQIAGRDHRLMGSGPLAPLQDRSYGRAVWVGMRSMAKRDVCAICGPALDGDAAQHLSYPIEACDHGGVRPRSG